MSSNLPEAAFHRQPVERQPADLTNGGLAILLLGEGQDCPDKYAMHGQVKPMLGSSIKGARDLDAHIPQNCKVVLFQGRLKDQRVFMAVHDVLKRRRLPYISRDNETAIEQAIDGLLGAGRPHPPAPTPPKVTLGDAIAAPLQDAKRTIAEKGTIKAFIDAELQALLKAEPQATSADLARKLFRIAQDKGISTTEGSLTQGIRNWKKDHRYTDRPASLQTDDQKSIGGIEEAIELTEQALKRMKAIKDLYLTQGENLRALQEENKTLKKKVAKAAEVFDAFRSEIE